MRSSRFNVTSHLPSQSVFKYPLIVTIIPAIVMNKVCATIRAVRDALDFGLCAVRKKQIKTMKKFILEF